MRGVEKFKGGARVEFVCGGRALGAFRMLRQAVDESLRFLSVLPAELPAAIERLQAELREARKAGRDVVERLAVYEAAAIAARAPVVSGVARIAEALFLSRSRMRSLSSCRRVVTESRNS